ncbi:hypothetical protein A8950_0808 [Dongia mobilis]|uniref:Uncharacterized protein n=1 Tax=Dongia mobilis TaxID=578943 RepID=A0A4R6WVP9_9PROT|nr:hypothetical protein [Dongia mobilis]TDQ84260.1 hypothetical protein A8950_0808 [Dongia mobilis]
MTCRSLVTPGAVLGACTFLLPLPGLAADLAASEMDAICGDRAGCQIIAVSDAGRGATGADQRVAEIVLALDPAMVEQGEVGCRSTEAALAGGDPDGGREFWLLAGDAAPVQILSLCNDGYGASGVGEDLVEIGDNIVTHSQYGGSAWRWQVSKTIRLDPLAVLREESCSYHNVAPGSGRLTLVDHTTLSAREYGWVVAGRAEDDLPMGCPEAPADATLPLPPQPAGETLAGYAVPAPFAADASQMPEGTTLGSCGLSLATDGARGFLIHGAAAAPERAAELRVIAETENALLIQVRDPLASDNAGATSWVGQPHVEIWTAQEGAGDGATEHVQIGITLDGLVHEGKGKLAQPPAVTSWPALDELGREVTVLRVVWADPYGFLAGLGVVYSQAEGGRQKRLVANAPIRKNTPLFLPGVWSHYPDDSGIPNGGCAFTGEPPRLDLDSTP